MRAIIEVAMGSMIPGNRFVQVIGSVGVFLSVVLLRFIPSASQVTVRERRCQFIAKNGLNGRPTSVILAAFGMVSRVINCPRRDPRLKDGRDGLRLAG